MSAMTLGGIVCIRNGDELDYCWREAVQSLLPVCHMVTVCDGESTDGTQEAIREWMKTEPKIVLCVYPWSHPVGVPTFWVDWLQYARLHTPTDYIIQLDADEVMHESSQKLVQQFMAIASKKHPMSAWCARHNFYRDAQHLIPPGVCLAHEVVRIMPQNIFLPSDGADPRGADSTNMAVPTLIEICHYGFIRKRDDYFRKSKGLFKMFFDNYDPLLVEAEKATEKGGNWMENPGVSSWQNDLLDYKGTHPEVMREWLKERNYAVA